jgi:hypothetical protein
VLVGYGTIPTRHCAFARVGDASRVNVKVVELGCGWLAPPEMQGRVQKLCWMLTDTQLIAVPLASIY